MDAWMEKVIEKMRENEFTVLYAATAAEAREVLAAKIDGGKSVGVGGSVTIRQLEVLPLLEEKECSVISHWGIAGDEAEARMKQAREADVYLCSANAITSSGKLMMIDGRGNRVGAICDGPAEVYFVASVDKIVNGGTSAAIARIKRDAAPPNCKRLGLSTPCAETGVCGGEACTDPSCRLTLVVDKVPRKRKMTVLLVGEKLGY